jgi:hypothetical protein
VQTLNLRAAQKELGSRSPDVAFPVLAAEAVVIVTVGVFLAGIFS